MVDVLVLYYIMDGTDRMEQIQVEAQDKDGKEEKKFFIPLGFKLITITSLIVIASLAGVAIAASLFFRGDNEARAIEDTLRNSALISQKVRSDLMGIAEKTKTSLASVTGGGRVRAGEESEEIFFLRNADIYYAAVLAKGDSTPRIELKNRRFLAGRAVNYAEILRANRETINKTFKGEEGLFNPSVYIDDAVTGMTIPFEIVNGKESIIIVIFPMEKLLESIDARGVIKSYIISGTGDVIAHYDNAVARSKANLAALPIVKMMVSSANPNGQTFYTEADGTRSLGAFQRIGFTDSAVISTVPEKTAFAAVYKIQRIILFITLIALSSAVIFIYFFSRSLTMPLGKLMDASNLIRDGDFNVSVPATTRDEIGQLGESFAEMAKGLGEREKMKDAFGRFVNKELTDLILKDEIKLGGERKDVVVLFSDIRKFTELSERFEPEDVVGFLNSYMRKMVQCVNDCHGSVDKFIGDAIMAVWGAPVSHGNDTENAINSAIMMRKALISFNKTRGRTGRPKINIGIGINTGPALAGQIGTEERMEYTVIGDTVNLASRIEALNKPFGTDILISGYAYEKVRHIFNVEPMRRIRVKGKTEAQRIYAVLGRKDDSSDPQSITELRRIAGIKAPPSVPEAERDAVFEDNEVKYEIIE